MTRFQRKIRLLLLGVSILSVIAIEVSGQPIVSRVKDIAQLDGAQDNPLFGLGLVAGLEGTGDGRRGFTRQSLSVLLNGMGVNVLPDEVIPDNVASVMVVANLPPFARPGSRINATVMSLGQAKSLQGGNLLLTPLKGADGKVHGIAYGSVSIGGFVAQAGGGGTGAGAAMVQKNHTAVGFIPNGVIIEGEPVFHDVLQDNNTLRWLLDVPDFKTASNLQRKINALCGEHIAVAEDAGAVRVYVGVNQKGDIVLGNQAFDSLVDAIAYIDDTQIETDEPAKIVINERTGTIVAGQDIRVRNVIVAHGPLRITIQTTPEVTPAVWGQTTPPVTTSTTTVTAQEGEKVTVVKGTTIGEVLTNLNALGFTPRDLIAIVVAMSNAGAIKAEIQMLQ